MTDGSRRIDTDGETMRNAGLFAARFKRLCQAVGASRDTDLANVLGIKQPSVASAHDRKQIPSKWIIEISEKFGVSADWLLFGVGPIHRNEAASGDPLRNAKLKPEVPQAPAAPPATAPPTPQTFRISDAISMAARVLESGTTYAVALYLNIEHFDRAIQAETRVAVLEEQMAAMQERMDAMEAALAKCVPRDDPGEAGAEEGRPRESGNDRVA